MGKLKDGNLFAATHFLRIYAYILFPVFFIGVLFMGPMWIFPALIISAPIAAVTQYAIGKAAGVPGGLYAGRRARWSLHETLEGDLNQVRQLKMKKEFEDALIKIDGVLTQAPEFPEALFLKGQILWEGYRNATDAKACLIKAMQLDPNRASSLHQWASSLYREIADHEAENVKPGINNTLNR